MDTLRGTTAVRQLRIMIDHLPPNNAVQRELAGPWDDKTWLLHDVSTQLRRLNANFYNKNRPKGQAAEAVKPVPTPETVAATKDAQDPVRTQLERDHLLAVVNRPNPT